MMMNILFKKKLFDIISNRVQMQEVEIILKRADKLIEKNKQLTKKLATLDGEQQWCLIVGKGEECENDN